MSSCISWSGKVALSCWEHWGTLCSPVSSPSGIGFCKAHIHSHSSPFKQKCTVLSALEIRPHSLEKGKLSHKETPSRIALGSALPAHTDYTCRSHSDMLLWQMSWRRLPKLWLKLEGFIWKPSFIQGTLFWVCCLSIWKIVGLVWWEIRVAM